MSENSRAPRSAPVLAEVIAAVDETAPPRLAAGGDPIGLHCGDLSRPVRKAALALDASLAALDAAAAAKADLLLVHHPRLWGGLATLREDDPRGRRAAKMARLGLAVFSAHTNLDAAPGGVNDVLADAAGLPACGRAVVAPVRAERLCKLVVFVPASHVAEIREAVCAAGAGAAGQYSDCTFRARGTGTFRCGAGTKPFQGAPGSFEEADEYRLETVFPEFSRERVLAALFRTHPYEEVAYDVFPLLNGGREYGFGRVGELPRAESVPALAARMAKTVGSTMAQYAVAGRGRSVRRAAVWSGAGVDAGAVLRAAPEVLIAGEVSYHDLETFLDGGVSVVTLGHGFSEAIVLKPWAARLRRLLPGVAFEVLGRAGISMRNV